MWASMHSPETAVDGAVCSQIIGWGGQGNMNDGREGGFDSRCGSCPILRKLASAAGTHFFTDD
jgi:hypothetical protein